MLIYATGYGKAYDAMARVWEYSARLHNADAEVVYDPSRPPARTLQRGHSNHVSGNTHKLDLWVAAAHRAIGAGRRCVLMDADTFVLGPLAEAFALFDGDIGYTTRTYRVPFNAGVVFVNPTQSAREFLARWQAENARLYSNRMLSARAVNRYGGVNQAAFAELLTRNIAKLGQLPCAAWNCEQTCWRDFGPDTRVVHLKGQLRKRVLNPGDRGNPNGDPIARIVARYREFEAAAVAAQTTGVAA